MTSPAVGAGARCIIVRVYWPASKPEDPLPPAPGDAPVPPLAALVTPARDFRLFPKKEKAMEGPLPESACHGVDQTGGRPPRDGVPFKGDNQVVLETSGMDLCFNSAITVHDRLTISHQSPVPE